MQNIDKPWLVILIIIGATLLISTSVISFMRGLKDPSEEAVWQGIPEGNSIFLEKGNYNLWCRESQDPGTVTIKDSNGHRIFRDNIDWGGTHNITINGVEYLKIGDLTIDADGQYTIESERSGTVYITPPIGPGKLCLLILVSVVLIVVGVFLLMRQEESFSDPSFPPVPPPPYRLSYASDLPSPSAPPPAYEPSSSSEPPCARCGTPLSFIPEYHRWYCYECQEYPDE